MKNFQTQKKSKTRAERSEAKREDERSSSSKGVVAIFITMMIMFVSLAIVLGLTVIFVGHLRILKGMGNSVIAFYAADSGIEKLLYEEKICFQKTSPCVAPCASDCFGLASGSNFSGTLTNGASYSATFSIRGGREHFESIGTFEGARRSVSVSR
jgi:hypothetical protein